MEPQALDTMNQSIAIPTVRPRDFHDRHERCPAPSSLDSGLGRGLGARPEEGVEGALRVRGKPIDEPGLIARGAASEALLEGARDEFAQKDDEPLHCEQGVLGAVEAGV
jgi:hypothetical protein